MSAGACDGCLARAWLLGRLSGHLDVERHRIWELLELGDEQLIRAVGGDHAERVAAEGAQFGAHGARRARARAGALGLELICACDRSYPQQLRDLASAPAVLHIAGGADRFVRFCAQDPVALVGARRANAYGTAVARSLGRALGAAAVSVVSGLASGVDTEAHRGALEAGGATIAVLPGSADRPYPAGNAGLHREVLRHGVAVSEVGPGTSVRAWMFAARNRLIAGLARLTVVVQATAGSGSLLTARASLALQRPVGGVPGPVTSPLSAGPHQLLANGAVLVRDAQDVLDALYGAGAKVAAIDSRPLPTADQKLILAAISEGIDTADGLVAAGAGGRRCLADIAGLELTGRIRRGSGGRLTVIP